MEQGICRECDAITKMSEVFKPDVCPLCGKVVKK